MAYSSLQYSRPTRSPLSFLLVLFLYTSLFMFTFLEAQSHRDESPGRTLATEREGIVVAKKKISTQNKNQTKPIKSIKTTSNSTAKESKTQSKLTKATTATTNSSRAKTAVPKTNPKNHTSSSHSSSPAKPSSVSIKKLPDLLKPSSPKSKTKSTKQSQLPQEKKPPQTASDKKPKDPQKIGKAKEKLGNTHQPTLPFFSAVADDTDDFMSEFRDFPSKLQDLILPDIEKISTTSKAYISMANQEITQGFKPLVGNKYASAIASLTSCIFLLLPLLLVSLLFKQIRTYISLQKILIFIQAYLAIYFLILSLAYFATGLEPLRFFYATSTSSYVAIQVFQTMGYVLLLVMQLLNLVVVFSSKESSVGLKLLGVAQTIVGLSVGLHYYATVFHRAIVGKPPKTSWKIHVAYAMCFLVICLFARAERRKKAYLQEDGGEDDKKS